MPLPAIPALASFFASIFTALIGFFATYLGKRLALVAAAIVAVAGAFTVFYTAVLALIAGLAVPYPIVGNAVYCFLPSNTQACISAVITAYVLRWVYEWKIRVIQYQFNF